LPSLGFGDPNFDLLKTMTAQMLVVAEPYDACGLTPVQSEAEKTVYSNYRTYNLLRDTDQSPCLLTIVLSDEPPYAFT
jgi:hypothetical protein